MADEIRTEGGLIVDERVEEQVEAGESFSYCWEVQVTDISRPKCKM